MRQVFGRRKSADRPQSHSRCAELSSSCGAWRKGTGRGGSSGNEPGVWQVCRLVPDRKNTRRAEDASDGKFATVRLARTSGPLRQTDTRRQDWRLLSQCRLTLEISVARLDSSLYGSKSLPRTRQVFRADFNARVARNPLRVAARPSSSVTMVAAARFTAAISAFVSTDHGPFLVHIHADILDLATHAVRPRSIALDRVFSLKVKCHSSADLPTRSFHPALPHVL